MTTPLKVIVADDESIIREGIVSSIPWDTLGLVVVAEAEDGEEALELALEHEVDMMLVDLSMPIMNGLELIKELKYKLPKCKISIITGHDEFTYAQEAIKLDVLDYILKPVDPKYLTDVLTTMTQKIEHERMHEKLIKHASIQLDKNIHVLREKFGQEWLKGNYEQEALEEQLQLMKLPKQQPKVLTLLIWKQDHQFVVHSERDKQLIRYAIENIINECIKENDELYFLFRDERQDIVIMNYVDVERAWFEEICEKVQRWLKVELQYCSIPLHDHVNHLQQAYMEAKHELYRYAQLTPVIKMAKQIIDTKYWEQTLSLEKIAASLNVTSVYLSRLFKQELGMNFIQYITYIRMKQAMHLLKHTNLTVSEISEAVGYDTQHYFSTAFRKSVGMSPIQYRKQ